MNFLVKMVSMLQKKEHYLVGTWLEEIYMQNTKWILHRGRGQSSNCLKKNGLLSTDVLFQHDTKICVGYWTSASEYVNRFGKLRDNFPKAYRY